jgi:ParB family chromosome partitioning protein
MSELNRRTSMFQRPPQAHPDLAVDATAQARLADLKLESVEPDPENPRRHFDETALASLAQSIKTNGLIQPIIVRPGVEGRHIIIAGERRWRAARLAGAISIKAIVRPNLQEAATLLFAQIAENESREPLSAREMVQAVARLAAFKVPLKEIAERLGLDPSRVTRIRALSDLPPELDSALDTMGIDPLYELLQHYKRDPDPVRDLLSRDPAPTRAAVRSLGERQPRAAPPEPELAPAQVNRATNTFSPAPGDKASVRSDRVSVSVRHDDYGQGRVVATTAVMPDRLPILFEGQDDPIQTMLAELTIIAVA